MQLKPYQLLYLDIDVQLNIIFHYAFTLQSVCLCFTQQHLAVIAQTAGKKQSKQVEDVEEDADVEAESTICLLSVHYLHAIERIFVFACMKMLLLLLLLFLLFLLIWLTLLLLLLRHNRFCHCCCTLCHFPIHWK